MKPQADDGIVILIDDAAGVKTSDAAVVLIDEGNEGDKLPKNAIEQQDGSVILPLSTPVTRKFKTASTGVVREESFHELHMRRLTGADRRVMDVAAPVDRTMIAIARSSGLSDGKFSALYDAMDAYDIDQATNIVLYFLGNGPRIGRSA